MSHSVTITRTTTSTTNTSYIVLNTGYLKSVPGLLKLCQLILGIVCVGIVAHFFLYSTKTELYFFLTVVTFMIGTFCLLLSCICSLSTGGLISKTIYELIYHVTACILVLIASILLLIDVLDDKFGNKYYFKNKYDAYLAAAIIGIINAILYGVSSFYAHRSYRGI